MIVHVCTHIADRFYVMKSCVCKRMELKNISAQDPELGSRMILTVTAFLMVEVRTLLLMNLFDSVAV